MSENKISSGVIYIFLIGCAILAAAFWVEYSQDNVDTSKWVAGIGTVTNVDYGKGNSGEMEYEYGGKRYNGYGLISCGNNLGEKYVIMINPNDPTDYVAFAWEPIFEDYEETYESTGEIVRIFRTYAWAKHAPKYVLEYVYKIGETEYKEIQSLPPSYKAGTYRVGQRFKVQFGGVRATRSILHLEMPVGK